MKVRTPVVRSEFLLCRNGFCALHFKEKGFESLKSCFSNTPLPSQNEVRMEFTPAQPGQWEQKPPLNIHANTTLLFYCLNYHGFMSLGTSLQARDLTAHYNNTPQISLSLHWKASVGGSNWHHEILWIPHYKILPLLSPPILNCSSTIQSSLHSEKSSLNQTSNS